MIQFLYQTCFPLFLQLFSNTKKTRPASQAACFGAAESHVCYVGRLFVVVLFFFLKTLLFFCPLHHSTATASSFFAFLFLLSLFQATGQIDSLLKEACARGMVTATSPLFPVPSPTTVPGSPFSVHCTHVAPACQQHSLLCTYRYRFLSLILLASVFISFAPSYLL